MQKIENKFIYFVLILIFIIVCFIVYIGFFKSNVDRNSYLSLIEGTALLNENEIFVGNKVQLSIGDIIETTKADSLAIIEWGDGSVTRLGGNTSVIINELYVSELKDNINISFNLLSGKTWSNVFSFLPGDSYFRQSFMDYEAAVRGTVFNVDLDNDYLYVVSHKIFLTSIDGNKIEISEQEPFKLSSFEFIRLEEFIRQFKDTIFEDLNRKLDNDLFIYFKNDILSKIDNIKKLDLVDLEKLNLNERNDLYIKVLSTYQDLNFIDSSDPELFALKISVKEKLLDLAPDSEKENILNSFVFDFKDSIQNNSYESLSNILNIFSNNTQYIGFSDDIFLYIDKININNINEALASNILNSLEKINLNTNIGGLRDTFDSLRDSFDKTFRNSIINLFGN